LLTQNVRSIWLRPGNATASVGAIWILSRLLPRLRTAFPRARLRVRFDGGFAAPEIFAFLEREGPEYLVAMAKNQILERRAARLMGTARRLSRESGETAHLYSECRYAASTWPERRRVVINAEVVRHPEREPKDNPHFVVTNLKQSPRHLYEAIYCLRGDIENRFKPGSRAQRAIGLESPTVRPPRHAPQSLEFVLETGEVFIRQSF